MWAAYGGWGCAKAYIRNFFILLYRCVHLQHVRYRTYCSCRESSVASGSFLPEDRGRAKGEVVLAVKICMRNRGIASHIVNLGARRRWVVSIMHRPLYPRGSTPVLTELEAGWALEPVWTVWRRGISAENWRSLPEVGITVRLVFVLGKTNPKLFGFHLVFLDAFAKLRKATFSVIMSVHPHGTTRLPLEEFSWNFIFVYFFENLSRKFECL